MELGIEPSTAEAMSDLPARPICFVVSPIGDAGSEIRRQADQLLNHVISPPAAECGFDVVRADQINSSGVITNEIIQHLLNDDMVVADLSGSNPNVFYELALRHVTSKPFVHMVPRNQGIPFDVAANRAIMYELTDLDDVHSAQESLKKFLSAGSDRVSTPFSIAVDLEMLKSSQGDGDSAAVIIGELASQISTMNHEFRQLRSEVYELTRGNNRLLGHVRGDLRRMGNALSEGRSRGLDPAAVAELEAQVATMATYLDHALA